MHCTCLPSTQSDDTPYQYRYHTFSMLTAVGIELYCRFHIIS